MISEILSQHAYLFEQIGVSYQKIYPYLNWNTFDSPITNNIHLTEKDKGKVFVYIKQFTANNGQQHASFTVGTHRNGGDKITFNTLKLLNESRDNFNQKPTITISPKANVENFNKKP